MTHLGDRMTPLVDGQLPVDATERAHAHLASCDGCREAVETERAWAHVHTCHACRDLVEREGWVKTRLAGLTFEVAAPTAGRSDTVCGRGIPGT